MTKIVSQIQINSREFRDNFVHNSEIVKEFKRKQKNARFLRPQRDVERLSRQGKMLPRKRLELLLDPGTPFLEFSSLAANMAYDGESPGASCITGIGIVQWREVLISAHDSSIKGGAWYPLSIKNLCVS